MLRLDELEVYKMAMEIGDRVWPIVSRWDFFTKDTVGKQLVRAADSIAANLSEGYGRFYYKENKQFGYYSRGSLYETGTWLQKAYNRNLIDQKAFADFRDNLNLIAKKLNSYIKSIGSSTEVRESMALYGHKSEEPFLPFPNDQ